ncbi:MAG: hypothetical protein J7604_20455 [Sporocytophaga sp.]|uniref:hypothetical protein n=1 Tax=Sporocytophaga sp. TaxID=2231183 RepID=UPI001AFFB036|nr:hypothetical protein [Sporocytophaga sp.]MBO9702595.1 hypothetical protein [Sporocytophaga sp.]
MMQTYICKVTALCQEGYISSEWLHYKPQVNRLALICGLKSTDFNQRDINFSLTQIARFTKACRPSEFLFAGKLV